MWSSSFSSSSSIGFFYKLWLDHETHELQRGVNLQFPYAELRAFWSTHDGSKKSRSGWQAWPSVKVMSGLCFVWIGWDDITLLSSKRKPKLRTSANCFTSAYGPDVNTQLSRRSLSTYLIGSNIVWSITVAKGNKQLGEDVLCKHGLDLVDRGFVIAKNILKSLKNYLNVLYTYLILESGHRTDRGYLHFCGQRSKRSCRSPGLDHRVPEQDLLRLCSRDRGWNIKWKMLLQKEAEQRGEQKRFCARICPKIKIAVVQLAVRDTAAKLNVNRVRTFLIGSSQPVYSISAFKTFGLLSITGATISKTCRSSSEWGSTDSEMRNSS